MKQTILNGVLTLALAAPGLMAQPKPKSQAEVDALKAMFAATTADARIAAAENVLTKYADTDFKAVALYFEAASYEQKGDYEQTVVFCERTIEADPNHYQAMLMLAQNIAQHTKEFDLDREEKLAKVEKYAKGALILIPNAPKPNPTLTDDQWGGAKKDFTAQAHVALGVAAMARKKYDVAEAEFKSAIENKADPATMVRLGSAYTLDGKYDDAIAQFDKVMAMADINAQIKQIAQAERVRAIQKKGAASKPDSPAAPANPAPPQVEVKKP
ncbi:MAG: tetratricopeptide repeat protein [Bryobacteraceae bacterium]|jgi:tetratricopeptide (TPR) repeat protein